MRKLLLFLLAIALLGGDVASAAEPAKQFLQALRQRRYFEVALDYLDEMAESPLAPIELRQTLLYERGVVLIEASRAQRDQELREKYLTEAQQVLGQFAGQQPDHPLANSAQSQMGNLIVERARMKAEYAKQPNQDRAKLLAEARASYEEAYKLFVAAQETVKTQLERIPKVLDPTDALQSKMIERRKQLRADYLQTQLLAAAIREETTDTMEKDSADYKKFLEEAAALYDGIYKKYRLRLAGLYARMYQGRANQKLSKFKDALSYYSELLDQPDSDDFRPLKTKTLRLAMECWLDASQKKYVEAIKQGSTWVQGSRAADDSNPDWLFIRFSLAKAYKMQADETKASNPTDKRTVTQSRAEARKQAQFVAANARSDSGDLQAAAKAMVAELGGPDRTGEIDEPRNFAEAKAAGKEALDSITTAELVVKSVPARIASEQDETVKADLQTQLDKAKETLATAADDSMRFYRMALALIDENTPVDEINIVRYLLCYLHYRKGELYDAAVLGEFVAQRYPDSGGARQCAKIAMACYLSLYNQMPEDNRTFETDRIVESAEYIVNKWPDQVEAQEALNTLIPFMINASDFDKAQEFLTRIPEDSPHRASNEMKVGRAMWGKYLRESLEVVKWEADGVPEGEDLAAKKAAVDQAKSQSKTVLEAAFGRMKAGGVTPDESTATALLSLAQAHVETQQPPQALEVLQHGELGPLTLVESKHAAASKAAFVEETYKTALKALIGSLSSSSDIDGVVEQAKGVMQNMQAAIGVDAEGQKRLISVYVGIAQDLERQLATADAGAKQALSKGFETFLTELSSGAEELGVLNWVAETFVSLGSSFDEDGAEPSAEATRYYDEALKTFEKILALPDLDDKVKTQIQMRIAMLQRKKRDFEGALESFEKLLAPNPRVPDLQVEAAKTLQDWAATPGNEEKYLEAIKGIATSGPKQTIWGWGKVATTTARFPKFKKTFHEARVSLADCRFKYAMTKSGEEKNKLLSDAKRDISITKRLFPDLGGDEWIPKYDALLQKIQKEKGDRPVGLKEFEKS